MMPQISISVPQIMLNQVERCVEEGYYSSHSEVIREGLRHLFHVKAGGDEVARFHHYLRDLARIPAEDYTDTTIEDIIRKKRKEHQVDGKEES